MKNLILFLLLLLVSKYSISQDTLKSDSLLGWKTGGMFSLNFSQTSFSTNWQAGGNNSLSGLSLLNLQLKYTGSKTSWINVVDMKYGLTRQEEQSPRKTDDNLELLSKFGFKASKNWYHSGSFSFKTQLAEGIEYKEDTSYVISRFMAPAYLMVSIGMDYKPSEYFSVLVAPLTGKITLVQDNELSSQGKFGVNPGKKSRSEFGGALKVLINKEIMKNVTFNSRFNTFVNYDENTQIDIDWQGTLTMKVNKYLATHILLQAIYDKDQIDELQFKEILGVGLTLTF